MTRLHCRLGKAHGRHSSDHAQPNDMKPSQGGFTNFDAKFLQAFSLIASVQAFQDLASNWRRPKAEIATMNHGRLVRVGLQAQAHFLLMVQEIRRGCRCRDAGALS